MGDKDPDSRLEDLPDDRREEFEERIEPIREDLHDDLLEKHTDEIKTQIEKDESELSDFNVVVSCFLESDSTAYQFIRTEPLIHQQEKNFDVLVAAPDRGVAVLVEIERTLLDRLPSKLKKFEGKMAVIQSNGGSLDVDSYFEDIINTRPEDIDYVLSSQHFSESDLRETSEKQGMNFVAWLLASQGNTCRIVDFTIKKDTTAAFDGHTDDELVEYINSVLKKGVEKQEYLNFTYSSSKYLKLKHMAIAMINRFHRQEKEEEDDSGFTYDDWKRVLSQDADLSNYTEEEKRTLFENVMEYGLECGVVGIEEDNSDTFENEYKIKTSATKSQESLIEELLEKMAEHRMADEYEKKLDDERRKLVTELEQAHATGGTTLADFEDVDDEFIKDDS